MPKPRSVGAPAQFGVWTRADVLLTMIAAYRREQAGVQQRFVIVARD